MSWASAPGNELQELVTEARSTFTRKVPSATDKGTDIKGETLNLVHHPEGDVLIVFGDSRGPRGPAIRRHVHHRAEGDDQPEGKHRGGVGVGFMNMPSNTTFEGGKPSNPVRG